MVGEKDLDTLLSSMNPILTETEYVFVSFPEGKYGDGDHLDPIGMFHETEGMTLIIPKHSAQNNNMAFESIFRCISLQVHSSLDAVGLTAAISRRLADKGISANVVAAYYHDHVFVPEQDAQAAHSALTSIG